MKIKINTPLTEDKIKRLKAGDMVLITGTIYTARDAAHKRLIDALEKGRNLPFEVKNSIIYYVGPTPAKPGMEIGAAGPTTSYRMDTYTPKLLNLGLKGMIGKGKRSKEVIESIVKNKAVYFGAIGGAAALISKSIKKSEVIAYEDLDSEAIRKLEVEDLPVTVIIDSKGNNLYEDGLEDYLKSL
ncbi:MULTISPECIES: Fe-S-containing hydro-lyase [Clostridium]|uniref:Hydro-lyase, Fe-S type, tartrate/fumarate subfamily, beta region n=2 Tax=Clostridium TaxID=1485 RepID=A7GJ34_CLOBL|nr:MULTISPECIES: Fe-S-containing hydro-lyase [Clostridium]ABS41812.1 hydro-lyase, Fe-S type, tartrate/fumarate subfamily, beta region [Clostridium botulinum F str. Langeland]ADG01152.1 hydro-lyase, Fe-S type, tartrate/fumarate subfamily, beta region [Clostridium botulinum F str. 230613]KKM41972.1 fumarate hydratase [Clostridium botulinum]MBY6793707.1 Fe-S-containing hydro-lyase [Clostridium botulinum]MBY6938838.1 Fe-S-containing hydro-lyase [Clostridium botulinum]